MSDTWILNGHEPVPADMMARGKWFEAADRHVGSTERDGIRVSTVFLGINHRFGEGPPLLFETMIFGGIEDGWQERCSTWDEATALHQRACGLAFPAH